MGPDDPRVSVPLATALPDALHQHPMLRLLRERIARSRAQLDAVIDLMPPPLAHLTQPGPVDEGVWVLLAANPSVATKLRQLAPLLEARLAQRGWKGTSIKVRVQRETHP
jgi:hypothetical protein